MQRSWPGRLAAPLLGLSVVVASPGAGAVDIFELEQSYLQRRLDEAWAYSAESRARRGGLHTTEGADGERPAIFAMSLLTETGPEYDAFHVAASMLTFQGEAWHELGHGPTFGYSRFTSRISQEHVLASLLELQDAEAQVDHLFVGWNVGISSVFLELGWRWRWDSVEPTLLDQLDPGEAAPYVGRKEGTRHAPFVKLRAGGRAYALKAFMEPGGTFLDPQHAYLEPSYRFEFGEDMALTSEASYKRLNVTADTPRARLALTETLRLARTRSVGESGRVWHDRVVVRAAIENVWAPDAQGIGEALGAWENYVLRAETEPYYAGLWYNERVGYGWGLGIAGTSEWEDDGTTLRVVLRYLRNYIFTEPSADLSTPWLFEFSAVGGW